MWSDELTLISTNGGDGWQNQKESGRRSVYANEISIGFSEFFQADQAGYRTAKKFEIHRAEYNGEPLAEHEGRRYKILRTYGTSRDIIEITLSDKSERMEDY